MQKRLMDMFFAPSDSDFMSKWEKIREKGFRWFYIRRAAVILSLMFVIFLGQCMIRFDFPTFKEWISVIIISILVAAVLTPLLWKEYQSIYKHRWNKKKNEYLSGKKR